MTEPKTYSHFQILQIIPAAGWHAVFWRNNADDPCEFVPLAFLALGEHLELDYETDALIERSVVGRLREVRGFDGGADGFDDVERVSQFMGYAAPGDERGEGAEEWRASCRAARDRAAAKKARA